MIRHSPAEAWLKYVIVHPRGFSNDDIRDMAMFAELDWIANWYLDKLRDEMSVGMPLPFLPTDKKHRASQRYIYERGLHYFFYPDGPTNTAFRVLELPKIKEFIESSLINNAPFIAIADYLTKSRNFPCTPADIQRYQYMFWNLDLLGSSEFKHLMAFRHHNLANHPNQEIAAQAATYKRAMEQDPRVVASELPFSPISAMLSQMRMGLTVSHENYPKLLMAAQVILTARVVECSLRDNKIDYLKSRAYVAGLRDLNEVLATVARPEEELRNQLASIAMKTDHLVVPTLKQLGENSSNLDVEAKSDDEPDDDDEE